MLVGIRLDLRHAVQHRAFEIEFHHHTNCFGQPGVHADGKIERADFTCLD
jgi:hypothetical protein